MFDDVSKIWKNAKKLCEETGGDLAKLNSAASIKFADENFRDRMWIGVTGQEQEGDWKWVDGREGYCFSSRYCRAGSGTVDFVIHHRIL